MGKTIMAECLWRHLGLQTLQWNSSACAKSISCWS